MKAIRKIGKLTLAEVGQRIGKSPQYVHLIENGYNPPLDVRLMLADVLEVSVGYLFDLTAGEQRALSILHREAANR